MYNPTQLKIDLKTIVDAMGKNIPHGFYTKRVFDYNGLRVERSYDGVEASYQGIPIDAQNLDISSELARYILKLVVSYEERYAPTVIKSPCGSVTTIYD